MKWNLFILCIAFLLHGCEKKASFPNTIQFGLLTLNDRYPTVVQQENQQILFSYPTDGDSVLIQASHFADVIDAYSQWLQKNANGKEGIFLAGRYRRLVWRGTWLFQLDLPLYQRPDDSTLNHFFAKFPESQDVLTGDLSSFPIRHRQNGGASVSRAPFWGVDIQVPLLIQRYRDELGSWALAKPLETPSEAKWNELIGFMQKVPEAPCLTYQSSNLFFSVYKESDAILIAWGNRTPKALCEIVQQASMGF